MKTAFSCFLAMLWSCLNLMGQPAFAVPVSRPLSVGDAVPDYLIHHLVHYKTPTARLSDFKDKLLILDFMATSCSSCMYHLAHWDSVIAPFGEQLQVLPVTYEQGTKLLSVLQKCSASQKILLPFVTQDSVLQSWFPHQFISHLVWIQKGIVKAITKPEYVTATNIAAVLGNDKIRWPVKKDVGRYDPAYPLLSPNSEAVLPANNNALRYYSVLPRYMNGFAAAVTTYTDSAQDIYRYTIMNHSIIQLYLLAFHKSLHFPAPLIHVETGDSSRFFYNSNGYKGDWYLKNGYCYQATLPLGMPAAQIQEKIVYDLNFYLGLNGRLEKRTIPCYVLRRDSSITPLPRPAGKTIEISGIAVELNELHSGLPCIDEVPGSSQTYIAQPQNFSDIPALKSLLLTYGIRLTVEDRQMEMLVISEPQLSP